MRAIWITWERQRRNHSISEKIGASLGELCHEGGRVARWLTLSVRTWRLVRREQPTVIFVQLPSLLLGVVALFCRRWALQKPPLLIVDLHNCCSASRLGRLFGRRIVAAADLTLVSNEAFAAVVDEWGGTPVVVPDPLPSIELGEHLSSGRQPLVLMVCSWAPDEPISAVIEAADHLQRTRPEVTIALTGRPNPRFLPRSGALPPNIRLLGYLPEPAYEAALRNATVVMDLSTLPECLVCGAYEAVTLGRPLILTDNSAGRAYFTKGVRFTNNETLDIARTIEAALLNLPSLNEEVMELREELVRRDAMAVAALQASVGHALGH